MLGSFCQMAPWLSEELRPEQHPGLFSKGSGQRVIAAGELLGTAVALALWTEVPTDSAVQRISLSGRTTESIEADALSNGNVCLFSGPLRVRVDFVPLSPLI